MNTTKEIVNTLNANEYLQRNIKKSLHYTTEDFINDAQRYVKAIQEGRMFCVINSVSKKGMYTDLSFYAHELNSNNTYTLLNYIRFFKALGYMEGKEGFRISECDKSVASIVNRSICYTLKNLSLLSHGEWEILAQYNISRV